MEEKNFDLPQHQYAIKSSKAIKKVTKSPHPTASNQ